MRIRERIRRIKECVAGEMSKPFVVTSGFDGLPDKNAFE